MFMCRQLYYWSNTISFYSFANYMEILFAKYINYILGIVRLLTKVTYKYSPIINGSRVSMHEFVAKFNNSNTNRTFYCYFNGMVLNFNLRRNIVML